MIARYGRVHLMAYVFKAFQYIIYYFIYIHIYNVSIKCEIYYFQCNFILKSDLLAPRTLVLYQVQFFKVTNPVRQLVEFQYLKKKINHTFVLKVNE